MVDELTPRVEVEARDGQRAPLPHRLEAVAGGQHALVPLRPEQRPDRRHVGVLHRERVVSGEARAAVGDRVHLALAGLGVLPRAAPDGHELLELGRLGGSRVPTGEPRKRLDLVFGRAQAHGEQQLGRVGWVAPLFAAFQYRDPLAELRVQPLGADVVSEPQISCRASATLGRTAPCALDVFSPSLDHGWPAGSAA